MTSYSPKETYDKMALAYAEKSETSVWNVKYDRPNVISLIPTSGIQDVLEIGCGSGPLTALLLKKGFNVSACDISHELVKIAKERLAEKANIFVADASKDLDAVPDESFDLIVSSLVFHYIEDWESLFCQFSRILRFSGSIVFSTHHPHVDWIWAEKKNYFRKEIYEDKWNVGGKTYKVHFYHRTLMEMFESFRANGFYVDILREPFPLPELEFENPKAYQSLTTEPRFLYFRLKRLNSVQHFRKI